VRGSISPSEAPQHVSCRYEGRRALCPNLIV
jgi:hypothetical protein